MGEKLGGGGMGVVYAVVDRRTNEPRALKRLSQEAAEDPSLVEAFEREYQVLAGLEHPRIIEVYDYGVDEAGPYYTMELLSGQDMRKAAPLPYVDACRLLRDVATSLALLHARRLLHRDLSPANVRMTADGRCKLIDFGALAAFGPTSNVVGTAPAIPPEALSGAPLDQRADLYSLGALAYWMLTGVHAYPAKSIEELVEKWNEPIVPPSELVPSVPKELDALVLALLSHDALARPATAAEILSSLESIGGLPPEPEGEVERLAQSFLHKARFTGRARELALLEARLARAVEGHGGAVRIEAASGMGRTRLLEEIATRAQLEGAAVLRVDAAMSRSAHGTARALVHRLLDAVPELAREHASRHRAELVALGHDVEVRLGVTAIREASSTAPGMSLEHWFAAVSRRKPLLVCVDDVEHADDASLGLLAALASVAQDAALLLVVTERTQRDRAVSASLASLRSRAEVVELSGLAAEETLELSRSLFGDAPNVARFAEWVHERTAGSPLHAIEIARRLVSRQVIRFVAGVWTLPADRPDAELPAALEDALSMRLDVLTDDARRLGECLSLERGRPSLALCRLLTGDADGRPTLLLLDELARNDVVFLEGEGVRFSSMALRDAVVRSIDAMRRKEIHRQLGEALLKLATDRDHGMRLEAGHHLIEGGDETRGADTIASVAADSVVMRRLTANLHRVGDAIAAALRVYQRNRRSTYERMPLLVSLASAGYYEDRSFGDRYGDEALDVLEDISGLRTARRIGRFAGRAVGLVLGLLIAFGRFHLVPKRERIYSFREVLTQLFAAVTTLAAHAGTSLDVTRAARVADVLEPFSILPERLTPVGVYQFSRGLQYIGADHHARTYAIFDELVRRFEDRRYYPSLPEEARILYVTGAHFARGAFAAFRADGRGALESADALDASGLKLYAMIASQLRFLYHVNRGELAKAAPHRERVELHAAQVGSAWQVEAWEAPALICVYTTLRDVVSMTRTAERLDATATDYDGPMRDLFGALAKVALELARKNHVAAIPRCLAVLEGRPPRSFIGWSAIHGFIARAHNELGHHEEARDTCARVLADVSDDDLEYVTFFLIVAIEAAIADAGLGDVERALARIDGLLVRFGATEHPLALGLLHEARARIALSSGDEAAYEASLAAVDTLFRPTGNPALVARYERLAALGRGPAGRTSRIEPTSKRYDPSPFRDTTDDAPVSELETVQRGRRTEA